MKATELKISKSEVMTKAWAIYKNCRKMFPTFSEALRRAWEVTKENVANRIKKAEIEAQTWQRVENTTIGEDMNRFAESLTNFYSTNGYHGD